MEAGQPKLVKGLQADYAPAIWTGKNTSCLRVFGKHVLVRVDTCGTSTLGGIMLTDEMVEKMTMAAETGCIFAIGPEAFTRFEDGTKWTGEKPELGDRVCFERYSGQVQRGADGEIYRLMSYGCISGAIDMTMVEEIGVEVAPEAKVT